MHHGSAGAWLSRVVKVGLSVVTDGLALRRNIVVLSLAICCVGLGEELWARFLPKYLEALGAGVFAIGAFGTLQELLEGLYPYPGGVLADRWGRKRALATFNLLALVGYGVYLVSPSWPFVFVGLGFTMAWSSLALPATFALIGDSLPPERRAMGFTVQSILKRMPTVLAPPLGGLLIGSLGLVAGVHVGLAVTLVLGTLSLLVQHRFYVEAPVAARPASIALRDTLRALPAGLKRLLLVESIVRTGQGLAEIFVILYVINVLGLSAATFGTLVALRMATSILVYIPVATLADRRGRTPFVVLSFLCFALFPFLLASAQGPVGLIAAFVCAGLREIGEPARKAMIVDLADAAQRGRMVGVYYFTRGLVVMPASLVGGMLWRLDPQTPFFVAAGVCLLGLVLLLVGSRSGMASTE
ncbi:MAG TPA: MFS transporter [Candidatus Tectomicrobia bacterium]